MAFAQSRGVFDWPEWKAFAARLGIAEVPTVGLTLRLHVDEVVQVTHDYLPMAKMDGCLVVTGSDPEECGVSVVCIPEDIGGVWSFGGSAP